MTLLQTFIRPVIRDFNFANSAINFSTGEHFLSYEFLIVFEMKEEGTEKERREDKVAMFTFRNLEEELIHQLYTNKWIIKEKVSGIKSLSA